VTYIKEFKDAVIRTKNWKLGNHTVNENPFAIDQTVLNAVEETGHIPFKDRAGKAMSVNFGMYHMLTTKFPIPNAIITMGNVSVNDEMLLPVTPGHFKNMLKNESGEEDMGQYHLWTTLPGGMILDHVIMSSLSHDGIIEVDDMIPSERFLYSHGDSLPHGLQYHPMVVGLEFFVSSGTIDREAMEYLMGDKFPKQYT